MERYVATQFYKADSPESRILRESGMVPSEFVLAADAQATIAALQAMNNRLGGRVETLEAQLAQRTAELAAARRERDEWIVKWDEHDHYPKGYVTAQIQLRERVQAELERVRGELAETKLYLQQERANRDSLAACVDRDVQTIKELRTLIAALPKVEGDFDVVARYRNENGSVHLNDEVKALLQHRQGMEG